MADTKIEWATKVWNPLVGCSKCSPGCDNCYAIGVVHRQMSPQHVGLTIKRAGEPVDWTGELREVATKLDDPLHWRKPQRVFVNSLSDLFHADVDVSYIAKVFAIMAMAPQHTFQLLTKRPQRMAQVLGDPSWWHLVLSEASHLGQPKELGGLGQPTQRTMLAQRVPSSFFWNDDPLPNVWLGTSIESDRYAFRADHLRATPAAVRWISAEPLLGPLPSLDLTGIDWLVVGGESGHGARPMHPAWAADLRDRCLEAGTETGGPQGFVSQRVPFFFKQHGEWRPLRSTEAVPRNHEGGMFMRADGTEPNEFDVHEQFFAKVGKRRAGRELDGRTWDEYPTIEGAQHG